MKLNAEERERLRWIAGDVRKAYQLGTHEQNKTYTNVYAPEDKALVERVLLLAAEHGK